MKSISTLIELKQRALDEKRRILVQLEEALEKLEKEEVDLKEAWAREADLAANQPQMASYFGPFSEGNEKQQNLCREKQGTIKQLIEVQRDQITEAFAELKQLEIAKEKREEEDEADAKRKENIELDEIGLRGFTGSD